MDGEGRECREHILESQAWTNIGHIRLKMPGAYFPAETESDAGHLQEVSGRKRQEQVFQDETNDK